jgi:hypothetical protein
MALSGAIAPLANGRTAARSSGLQWAGWSGLAMLAVIVVNGPLASLRGVPDYWAPGAGTAVAAYLSDPSSLRLAVIFFFASTLIFVFGIPFFSGLRELTRRNDASGVASGAVTIGAAVFFAGGLISEVMAAGMATVVQAAPSYVLDPNAALAIQGLQFAALLQGQVGLGVVMIAVSLATRFDAFGPRGLVALGLIAGVINIVRPLAVTTPPLALALFLPTFVWIALAGLALIRSRRPVE